MEPLQVRNALEDARNSIPRELAAAFMDARIDAVLEVLRELKAATVARAVMATSICAGGCWSGTAPGLCEIFDPFGYRMVLCSLKWMEDTVCRWLRTFLAPQFPDSERLSTLSGYT